MNARTRHLECSRSGLERVFDRVLTDDLSNRVLTLDEMAATTASQLATARQRVGRIIDLRDTLIAGIAQSHRATIATRNTRHFRDLMFLWSIHGMRYTMCRRSNLRATTPKQDGKPSIIKD